MDETLEQVLRVVFSITLVFVLLGSVLFFMGKSMENTKQEQQDSIIPYCAYECQKYDMRFHELVNDGWMWDCWCMADKPHFTKRYDGNDYNN